jgi:hypothetical protein
MAIAVLYVRTTHRRRVGSAQTRPSGAPRVRLERESPPSAAHWRRQGGEHPAASCPDGKTRRVHLVARRMRLRCMSRMRDGQAVVAADKLSAGRAAAARGVAGPAPRLAFVSDAVSRVRRPWRNAIDSTPGAGAREGSGQGARADPRGDALPVTGGRVAHELSAITSSLRMWLRRRRRADVTPGPFFDSPAALLRKTPPSTFSP